MANKKTTKKKKKTTRKKNDDLQSKYKKMEEELAKLRQEIKEKNDKLLRAIADLQNYRKRMEKELKIQKEEVKKNHICELIDLYELLRQAYEDKNPREGLKLMLNNIEKLLEKENVEKIECIGKKFDHNIHHAISTVEKEGCENDIIVEEIKKGYLMEDKLLRPSQVIVAKNKKEK